MGLLSGLDPEVPDLLIAVSGFLLWIGSRMLVVENNVERMIPVPVGGKKYKNCRGGPRVN
jgi:hypothetical protein